MRKLVEPYAVIFPFLGSEVGGSHIATFRLGRWLKDLFGLRCLVLCAADSRIAAEAARYGLDVASTGERPTGLNHPLYDLTKVRHRRALLQRYGDADTIVHINDLETTQSWAPCVKLAGQRVVYQHQSLNSASLKNRFRLAFADAFIAVSDECRRNLHFVDQRRLVKVPYSYSCHRVDRAEARRNVMRDSGVSDDSILLGFVGNFWNRKRPYFFLEAARHIAAAEPRTRFLVFGNARQISKPELEAHAEKLGLRDAVSFMGFRSPPEENIAALDVLLAPAINEPFGLTPVEALLLGTPYVVTADAGHLEIVERWQGGLAVPKAASPKEFAAAALEIVRGEVSPVVSPQRRAEIALELSPRAQAEAVLTVYRRLRPTARAYALSDPSSQIENSGR